MPKAKPQKKRRPLLDVSQEYVDDLCRWIDDFGLDPNMLTMQQFLAIKGLGHRTMGQLLKAHGEVQEAWDVATARLACRWQKMVMDRFEDDVKPHAFFMMKTYIQKYDRMGAIMALDDAKELKNSEIDRVASHGGYTSQSWKDVELDGQFKVTYEDNVNKRRGGANP